MAQVETRIDSVRVAVLSLERTVILKQKGADNYLPFWVDEFQGDVIAAQLQRWPNKDIELDRFLANSNASNARVKSTTINIEEDTYYATILLSQHRQSSEIKCPIGIGIAVALRARAPILVDEAVFNKAGVCLPPTPCEPHKTALVEKGL